MAHWHSGHIISLTNAQAGWKEARSSPPCPALLLRYSQRVLRGGVHVSWAALLQTNLWDGHSGTKVWSKLGRPLVTYRWDRRNYLPALSSIKKLSPEHWCHLEKQKELDTNGIPLLPLNQPVSNKYLKSKVDWRFFLIISSIIPFLMFYIIHPNYYIFPGMWDINKVVIKSRVDE